MRIAKALVLLAAVTACDSSTDIGASVDGSLSFAIVGEPGLFGGNSTHENPMSVGGHTIALTSVRFTVSEVELEGESDQKFEWKGGDSEVTLGGDGNLAVSAFSRAIAAGTYDELELQVETVRIRGSFDGRPFDITVAVNDELELEFDSPIEAAEGSTNITVAAVVESWFRTSLGGVIDPTTFNSTVESQLRSRIIASLDAFEDSNKDARRD